ncbi:Gustatory receptor 103 [Halyomorpha halys]|nr:Gustatory receptor 103 [Halyomorpha halys]
MDLDEALQNIFWIPRLLGTFPFDTQFNLSMKLLLYCCLVRFLSFFGMVLRFMYSSPILPEHDEVRLMRDVLRFVALFSAFKENILSLLWWVLKRHRTSFLMESINAMQKKQKITLGRHRVRLVHVFLLLKSATNFISYSIFERKKTPIINIAIELSCIFSYSSTTCFVGQFWDLLHLLGYLFRISTQTYDESSVINYERFLALCDIINELYGLQVLFTITESFLQIIAYFYILLLPMFPGLIVPNLLIISYAINCIIHVGAIILACNFYINQERNFNDDLRRRIVEDKSRVLLKNEKLNFHFVASQETAFTACGLFTVDVSFICSMISAATTYLVIVLQFSGDDQRVSNSTTISSENV